MEFTFGDEYKDGPLALGMHKRGNFHDIVTVSGCRIVDEEFFGKFWIVLWRSSQSRKSHFITGCTMKGIFDTCLSGKR